jgi:Glycine zipper
MLHRRQISFMLATALAVSPLAALTGCESLPGDEKSQGAVIGGLSGAAAGALIGGEDNRLLGALIGGAAGAGGGYLIGANWDKITGDEKDEAREANRRAQERPARASDVDNSRTADLNEDGFVTLDEVVAMADADLSDEEQIRRLERTQQYFELTTEQEEYLRNNGVTRDVVVAMRRMNPEQPRRASETVRESETRTDPISGDRD